MRDVARRLAARPAQPGRWHAGLAATPAPYRELIRDLTEREGAALAQCGALLQPIVGFGRLWQSQVWTELIDDFDELITMCGGTPQHRSIRTRRPSARHGDRQDQVERVVTA